MTTFDPPLTEAEQLSLSLAESDRTYQIRLVYFDSKRCPRCTERRSCEDHMHQFALL